MSKLLNKHRRLVLNEGMVMGEGRWGRGLSSCPAAWWHYFSLLCSQRIWAKTTVLEVTIQCSKHALNTQDVTSPEHFPVERRGEGRKKKSRSIV